MKRLNNKGFTLVEILAVVAIIAILFGIAITAYTKYIDFSRAKAYDFLANAAYTATQEYVLDNPSSTEVTFDQLIELQYLEGAADPKNKEGKCKGKVGFGRDTSGQLSQYEYKVYMCCSDYYYVYIFPGNTKIKKTSCYTE